MPVLYDGKKITPAPFVSISKEYNKTPDGVTVGSTFTLTLTGTLIWFKGSPQSDKDFTTGVDLPDETFTDPANERHTSILRKQEALRDLFSTEGLALEFVPWEDSPPAPMKCYPRVLSINFTEGGWHTTSTYTITLEADDLLGIPGDEDQFTATDGTELFIQDAQESWNIEFNERGQETNVPFTFRVTHNINAVGKRSHDGSGPRGDAWEQARKWVYPKMGFDAGKVINQSGTPIAGVYNAYNHVRNENIDEKAGSYGITETWLLSSGSALEDFTVSTRTSAENSLAKVTVEGSITGLEVRDSNYSVTTSKWDSAKAKYAALTGANKFFVRAEAFGTGGLNTNLLNSSVGRNPVTGTINYSYEYDSRESLCIPGALSENFTISQQDPSDIFATIGVIGRTAGPVLQALGTISERKQTVGIEVVMPVATGCPNTAAAAAQYLSQAPSTEVAVILAAFQSNLTGSYNQVFVESDQTQWTPKNGRYSRTITWVYQNCT